MEQKVAVGKAILIMVLSSSGATCKTLANIAEMIVVEKI
jgi:hypothetical protein